MVLDTQKSLLTYIYNLLTNDTDLKAAMGGTVRLELTWAKPDTVFPYLVHRLDIVADDFYPMRRAVYYLDIWSDSDTAEEILAIRQLIIALLDELEFSTTEATRARFLLQTDGFIPEVEQGIWHYAIMFNLVYFRDAEIAAIDAR